MGEKITDELALFMLRGIMLSEFESEEAALRYYRFSFSIEED